MNLIFQDVKETIFSLQKEILNKHSINENIKKLFLECQRICGMFAGDMKCIINEYNINNIHLIILGNIFYRFHLNDFIRGLQKCLDTYKKDYDKDNDLVNKIIIRIIKNCDSNQIEIVQELKGNYPFLLRYHMIEILSQNEFLYHIENQERYLKQETFLFYQMLRDSKIPFKYYLNYFLFCPNFEIFTDRIVVMDNGRVAAFDTHENLQRTCAIYSEIYRKYLIATHTRPSARYQRPTSRQSHRLRRRPARTWRTKAPRRFGRDAHGTGPLSRHYAANHEHRRLGQDNATQGYMV